MLRDEYAQLRAWREIRFTRGLSKLCEVPRCSTESPPKLSGYVKPLGDSPTVTNRNVSYPSGVRTEKSNETV